jgi:hypothetical protein
MYNSGYTITIANPNFIVNSLNIEGNITFNSAVSGRIIIDNSSINGNVICKGFTDIFKTTISGGTLTVASTAHLSYLFSTNRNQIISAGTLQLIAVNMKFALSEDYLIKSTAGTIQLVDCEVVNTLYASRQYSISCNNEGSAATPNILTNVNLTVYGVINSGTAYTSFASGSVIFSPDSFAVSSHLTPVPLALGTTYTMLGSDATGDLYYRNASGIFARLPIGTEGQVLSVSADGLPYWKTL